MWNLSSAARIGAVALLGLCLVRPAIAAPSVALSPATTHPQGATRVSGTGFGANEAVDIYLDQTDTLLEVTNGAGAFGPDKIAISAFAAVGDHWITAIGRKDGVAAHRKLVVSTAWASYGFNARGRRRNPYENIINVANVGSLDVAWAAVTGDQVFSSPAAASGLVYVGSEDHNVYAFDSSTGAEKWTATLGGRIFTSPAIAPSGGAVYVASTDDGKVWALNSTTGSAIWAAPAETGSVIDSSPAIANGNVYVGTEDGHLWAFNTSTGAPAWASPAVTGQIDASSPAVGNGIVYVGEVTTNADLYAFDATTGATIPGWPVATGGGIESSPALANGIVYIGAEDHKIYALNAKTGAAAWPSPVVTGSVIRSSAAVANGIVYVGSLDTKLYAVNAASGQLLWTGATGAGIEWSSPAVANGVVYVGSLDKRLYAFNANGCGASTCAPLWSAATGGIIEGSSPTVSDGMVFVGSDDSSLHAFSLNAGNAAVYRERNARPPAHANLHPDFRLKPVNHTIRAR